MIGNLPAAGLDVAAAFQPLSNGSLTPPPQAAADREPYKKILYADWGDMDFNGHMNNKSYLDKVVDVRLMYLAEHGFPPEEFKRLMMGPIVEREELEYRREINLLQPMTVTFEMAGHSPDGSRYRLRHDIFRHDGKLAARVTSIGGYMDHAARKRIAPPRALFEALEALKRTSDYIAQPSAVRRAT